MNHLLDPDTQIQNILTMLMNDPLRFHPMVRTTPPSKRPAREEGVVVLGEELLFDEEDLAVTLESKSFSRAANQQLFKSGQMPYRVFEDSINKEPVPLVHRHDFFELFYVYRGCCLSTIQGQEICFYTGDICLYNINSIHSITVPTDEEIVFNVLIRKRLINETFLSILENQDLFMDFFVGSLSERDKESHLVVQKSQMTFIESCIKQMVIEYYTSNNQNYLKSLFTCVLNQIGKLYKQRMIEQNFDPDRSISIFEIIDYLEQNCSEVSLESIAAHFHCSANHIAYCIKKYTNRSFSEMIRKVRLKKACILLRKNIPIDQIVETVGYYDRSYLEKVFKQQYNISMAQYRKRSRRNF